MEKEKEFLLNIFNWNLHSEDIWRSLGWIISWQLLLRSTPVLLSLLSSAFSILAFYVKNHFFSAQSNVSVSSTLTRNIFIVNSWSSVVLNISQEVHYSIESCSNCIHLVLLSSYWGSKNNIWLQQLKYFLWPPPRGLLRLDHIWWSLHFSLHINWIIRQQIQADWWTVLKRKLSKSFETAF